MVYFIMSLSIILHITFPSFFSASVNSSNLFIQGTTANYNSATCTHVFLGNRRKGFFQKYSYAMIHRANVSTRAGGKAVDLGWPSVYQEGQSLKVSTKAAVFKRVSLLIGGRASMSIRGACPPYPWRRPWY